ncbi:hypothetical protein Hanom_Chr16g01492521 [Helianthus anomalus]
MCVYCTDRGSSNWYQRKGCEEWIKKKNTIRGLRHFDCRSYKKKERNQGDRFGC